MIKAIAVDDEPIALDIISQHAQKVPFIKLVHTFISATEALSFIAKEHVQLIFLDIQMPDLSGLDFAALVGTKAQIVFTTAYPDHAIKGFDLAVTDYLLKPIDFNRFLQSCYLAQSRLPANPQMPERSDRELFVKDGYQWVRISVDNILYIQADDNYITIYETDKKTMTRLALHQVLAKLPVMEFQRVNKSNVVALNKIDKIERHQVTLGGIKIPVSQSYYNNLIAVVNK